MVRADLAVTAWLASTVPTDLEILDHSSTLPELPHFTISLHAPRHGNPASDALAMCIRNAYLERQRAA